MGCGCNKINKRKCSCQVPCGCEDKPITTCLPCMTLPCNNGDQCPETFSAGCVVYTGDTIVDLNIQKGDRLDSIIQKMALLATNPGCAYPTSPCQSVLGLQTTSIYASVASLKWFAVSGATGYQVQYKVFGTSAWSINPVTTNLYDNIGPLTPNTTYWVNVISFCGSNACQSLTIQFTTPAT